MIAEADIHGHWVRRWIKAPGFEDHATRVHWIQVGRSYADVRVPLERPDLAGARCLGDLPAGVLAELARAEGFAGRVSLDGSLCTWHREINWHGVPDTPDIGDIRFDPEGRMIEAGVLADYTELWERRGSIDPMVLRLQGGGYTGVLAAIGSAAVLGIGRKDKPATRPLVDALAAGRVPPGIDSLFDGLHAFGRLSERVFVAEIATEPFAEGTEVLTVGSDAITWHRRGFDGTATEVEMHLETVAA